MEYPSCNFLMEQHACYFPDECTGVCVPGKNCCEYHSCAVPGCSNIVRWIDMRNFDCPKHWCDTVCFEHRAERCTFIHSELSYVCCEIHVPNSTCCEKHTCHYPGCLSQVLTYSKEQSYVHYYSFGYYCREHNDIIERVYLPMLLGQIQDISPLSLVDLSVLETIFKLDHSHNHGDQPY